MTDWDDVDVGDHQFQVGALEADPIRTVAETDVFTVSSAGLVIVRTGISAGPATVGVALLNAAPDSSDLQEWDNVAETTIKTTHDLHVMSVDGDVYDNLGPIPAPATGAVTLRISARGRAANWDLIVDSPAEVYLIQAWPSDGRASTRQLKSSDEMWASVSAEAEATGLDDPGPAGTEDGRVRLRGPAKTRTGPW